MPSAVLLPPQLLAGSRAYLYFDLVPFSVVGYVLLLFRLYA